MNDLECKQLVIIIINSHTEEQTSVSLVHYLLISVLKETTHLWFTGQYHGDQLTGCATFLLHADWVVPFLETELALPAE